MALPSFLGVELDPHVTQCGLGRGYTFMPMGILIHATVLWRRQLWGTGARAPLDFQQFSVSVNFRDAQSLTAICAVVSPNVFVFCESSCRSSVIVLFCVTLCATKSFM